MNSAGLHHSMTQYEQIVFEIKNITSWDANVFKKKGEKVQ